MRGRLCGAPPRPVHGAEAPPRAHGHDDNGYGFSQGRRAVGHRRPGGAHKGFPVPAYDHHPHLSPRPQGFRVGAGA
ncbi:unnamed protein product, partial [Laminaria digitata]